MYRYKIYTDTKKPIMEVKKMKTLKKLSAVLVAFALACPTVFSVSADAD